MGCTAGPSGVRRPPWEVLPSRRPIVQRPRADCEDDPEPGTRTSTSTTLNPAHVRPERRVLHNEPRLDDPAHVRPERRALHNEPRLDDTIFSEVRLIRWGPLGFDAPVLSSV